MRKVARIVTLAGLLWTMSWGPAWGRPLVIEEEQIGDAKLRQIISALVDDCNGYLDIGMNVSTSSVSHTFSTVDTEETIDISALGLEYIPTSFLQYDSTTGAYAYPFNKGAWTSSSIRAKSTKTGTVAIWPFAAGPQQ